MTDGAGAGTVNPSPPALLQERDERTGARKGGRRWTEKTDGDNVRRRRTDEFDKKKCPASSFTLFFPALPVPVKLAHCTPKTQERNHEAENEQPPACQPTGVEEEE